MMTHARHREVREEALPSWDDHCSADEMTESQADKRTSRGGQEKCNQRSHTLFRLTEADQTDQTEGMEDIVETVLLTIPPDIDQT